MSNKTLSKINKQEQQYFEGLEIGAVSVKWVRRTKNGHFMSEVIRHEGSPKEKIKKLFKEHSVDTNSRIVITGQATNNFLNLPYKSEVECLEKALSFYNLKPDILLSLGGETFSVFPMKDGIIKNIISTTKCAAGTGEFIIQQLQRMGMTIEEGIKASLHGEFTQLATRCSVHCKSDATHKLNKGECKPEDIVKNLLKRRDVDPIQGITNYYNTSSLLMSPPDIVVFVDESTKTVNYKGTTILAISKNSGYYIDLNTREVKKI